MIRYVFVRDVLAVRLGSGSTGSGSGAPGLINVRIPIPHHWLGFDEPSSNSQPWRGVNSFDFSTAKKRLDTAGGGFARGGFSFARMDHNLR